MERIQLFFSLHALFFVYSLGGICNKMAGREAFGSTLFFLWYGGLLGTLIIYAIGWQQIIRYIPVSIAVTNKAVTLLWSMFFGVVIFDEAITMGKIIGLGVVIIGVVLYSTDLESCRSGIDG